MENNTTLKKVLNIVFYVVLAIVFIYAIFGLFSKKEDNSISFLGISSMTVLSDSMTGTFEEGDLIFINRNFDVADLSDETGNESIITYRTSTVEDGKTIYFYNTHKIEEIYTSGGVTRYKTIGTKPGATTDPVHLLEGDIYGVWTGTAWSGFGSFIDGFTNFLKSSLGFFLLIVVPCLGLLAYEGFKFVKIYADYNVQKHKVDRVKMQEEAIAEAKAQLEAEAKAKADENKSQQEE
jgi:signal peptidase I